LTLAMGALTHLGRCLNIRYVANETVICTYRVRPDAEDAFVDLLGSHWHTLHDLGFVTDEESLVFRGLEGGLTYVEIFTWVEGGFGQAHEHPDVLAIWEPMDPLLEEREGKIKWEFPHFERVSLGA
jgi:hypothetical protein